MTKYLVMKHTKHESTHVDLVEALTDLGYVHPKSVAAMLEERKKQRWPVCHKCGGTDFEWNANTKRHYCSVCNANYDAPGEKPKIDLTTLREDYFVILQSHPDKPDTRVPCSKCGHTEFTKIAHHGLYCSKCATLNPLSGERKPSCLNCGSTDYVWHFDNGESAYCSKCSPDTPSPPKPSKPSCLNCGSTSYASCWWRLSDGEVSYCSECSKEQQARHDARRDQSSMVSP